MLKDVIDLSVKKRAMLQRQLAAFEHARDTMTDEQLNSEVRNICQQIIYATRIIARCERDSTK